MSKAIHALLELGGRRQIRRVVLKWKGWDAYIEPWSEPVTVLSLPSTVKTLLLSASSEGSIPNCHSHFQIWGPNGDPFSLLRLSLATMVPRARVWIRSVYPPGSLHWLSSSEVLVFQGSLLCPRLRSLFFPKEVVADCEGGLHFFCLKMLWKVSLTLWALFSWPAGLLASEPCTEPSYISMSITALRGCSCLGWGQLYLLASGRLPGRFTHRGSGLFSLSLPHPQSSPAMVPHPGLRSKKPRVFSGLCLFITDLFDVCPIGCWTSSPNRF